MSRFTVVGSPGGRRVAGFAAACRAAGLPEPTVISWLDVFNGSVDPLPTGVVRIDSPGGEPEADAALRGAGDPARVRKGSAPIPGMTSRTSSRRSRTSAG